MRSYFPYLEAKGLFMLRNAENTKSSENTELHGNHYSVNSRSRAGSICQTRMADLVVSRPGLCALLSSVFPFPSPVFFSCFRLFSSVFDLQNSDRKQRGFLTSRVNNGQKSQ